ncbi:MAG: hypothetical protein P1U36_05585 [Legionellaceae bacterium]|nr:hypothetical protein [Legionellaceae bacterium]
MPSFESIQRMIDVTADAHSVSQYVAYTQETVDSGTKNKLWSFRAVHWLANITLFPLISLFSLNVWLVYFSSALPLAVIFYVASVAHGNQLAKNTGELDKIKRLPWDLHQNTYLTDLALFLSVNFVYPLFALYVVALAACFLFGSPWFACVSLAMYALDQLYQREYLPEFLEMPYLCMSISILLLVIFGVTSYVGIGLSLAMVVFTVIDHVLCNELGQTSPTVQFPNNHAPEEYDFALMSSLEGDYTKALDDVVYLSENPKAYFVKGMQQETCFTEDVDLTNLVEKMADINFKKYILGITLEAGHTRHDKPKESFECRLKAHEEKRGDRELHVTFDHFYESYQLVEDILKDVPFVFPERGYKRYLELFAEINFKDEKIRDFILCQMYAHDKFNGQNLESLSKEALAARQEDFLKQEMQVFVERLEQASHRDFSHLQAANMHGYARLLLSKMDTPEYSPEERADLLLAIAMTTGSHCYRSYPQNLSDFAAEKEILFSPELTLREHALLVVQDIREAAFRTYYDNTVRVFNQYFYFNIIWGDIEDYFTYEDFVYWFGLNLYLRNVSFTLGFREASEVLWDRAVGYFCRGQGEYDFALMSSLDGDFTAAQKNTIYISEESKTYFVKGMEQDATFAKFVDLTHLEAKLADANFHKQILTMTSKAGHTLQRLLFCEYYTIDFLVEQAINPEEKLYPIFAEWCVQNNINIWDEEHLIKYKSAPNELRALAEFMLLELKIFDVKKPAVSQHAWFQPAPLSEDNLDNVVSSSNHLELS